MDRSSTRPGVARARRLGGWPERAPGAAKLLVWWARVALAAAVVAGMVGGATAAAPRATPDLAITASSGLASAHWQVETPTQVTQEFQTLLLREGAVAAVRSAVATTPRDAAVPAVAAVAAVRAATDRYGSGGGLATSIAIRFALQQRGKPYLWGATGPSAYDCSGLTQRSYAEAGVVLPRRSVNQAQVGSPIRLAELLPGDLVFWAYDPANLNTVHHVAMYLGAGLVVQAPKTGDVVKVSSLWLSGYAGAVRVASPGSAVVPGSVIVPPGVVRPGGTTPGSSPTPSAGEPFSPATPISPTTPGPSLTPGLPSTPGPVVSATTAPATTPTGSPPTTPPTTPPPTTPPTTAPAVTPTDVPTSPPAADPEPTDAPPTTPADTPSASPDPTTDPTTAPTTDPAPPASSAPASTEASPSLSGSPSPSTSTEPSSSGP